MVQNPFQDVLATLINLNQLATKFQHEIQAYSSEKPRIKTHRYLSSFLVSSRSLVSIRRCQHLNTPRRFAIRPFWSPSVGEETHRAQSRINRAAKLYRDAAAVRLEDDLYSTGFTIGSREWKRPPAWNDLCTCTSRDCTPHPLARLLFHRYCSTRFLFPTSSIMKENLIWKDRGPSSCLRDESSFSQSLFSFFFISIVISFRSCLLPFFRFSFKEYRALWFIKRIAKFNRAASYQLKCKL